MMDYLAYFGLGERFQNSGNYDLACEWYAKASMLMQRTSDINLRQMGVNSYNSKLDNNLMYCLNKYKQENPGFYLEISSDGTVNIKTITEIKPSVANTGTSYDYSTPVPVGETSTSTIPTSSSTTKVAKQPRKCARCNGTGIHQSCNGTGKTTLLYGKTQTVCAECHGTGKCPSCGGTGYYNN